MASGPVSAATASSGQVRPRALRAGRWLVDRSQISSTGLFVAAVFFCLSLTPSLLPRTWQVQGLISGFSASMGYAVGVLVAFLWTRSVGRRWKLPARVWAYARPGLIVATSGMVAYFLYQGSVWQRQLYELMGATPPDSPSYLGVLAVTTLVLAGLLGLARGLRALSGVASRLFRRWIPPVPARLAGITAVGLLVIGLLDNVVYDGFLSFASSTAIRLNDSTEPARTPPTSPYRSGSPQSLVSWESLGRQGRMFVTGAPSLEELRQFGGPDVKEPIRVYVGLKSAPTLASAAALAVRELERTGAFSRSILCVVTTTGTGWVDPYVAAALEFMHNGDTAIVGTQYSALPSWISFLTEKDRVREAGRELFNQVYAKWSTLPPGQRPRLLVFGESLGSLGSEAAFRDLDDIRARTDGVLWAGPTYANPLRASIVRDRDPGSTEVLPIYRGGETVRFVSTPSDLQLPPAPWHTPRVVYLQNPSDPVIWWSPQLLFKRPDWLVEPRGHDVLPQMRWYPFVTFFQVTADLALAQDAPAGHGHRYRVTPIAAWAAIAPPASWSPQRTAELNRLLEARLAP